MEKIKESVRPIFNEIKGYLSAVEVQKDNYIYDESAITLSNQVNNAIKEINQITEKNFDKFKIELDSINWNGNHRTIIRTLDYKTKLNGLIQNLKGAYFEEDDRKFSSPNTIINTHQNQTQNQQQTLVVDMAMLIAEKKSDYQKGSKERDFLDKAGESLKSSVSATEVIKNIISIAKDCGLTLATLSSIFGIL